jgi:hypothetical protein
VTLETQARQNAERAAAAEAEIARIKALPLKERLKYFGDDRETLEEALLVGGDDIADLPEKPAAKVDPVVAELKAEVDALKAERAARAGAETAQAISAGHAVVAEQLKDVATVPMVKAVRDIVVDGKIVSGIDLTLQTAHTAWLQAGKAGHPREYVAGAAEAVEAYLREKRPDLAEVIVGRQHAPASGKGGTPVPPARSDGAPSIGKRTAPRPDSQPTELPMNKYERDQMIKREMGWT